MLSNLVKKDGFNFAFDPNGCNSCAGNCCIGESGYIWINSVEIQALALHLKISAEDLKKSKKNQKKGPFRNRTGDIHLVTMALYQLS